MFGIGATEFILLIVIAVIMFGPEKIPEFSRKAARVFVAVRDVANNAQTQLRSELGPEYADLNIQDLNPKTFVAKHLREEIQMIDEAKNEIAQAGQEVKETTTLARQETREAEAVVARKAAPRSLEKPGSKLSLIHI